jgi:hypothetical protein
MYGLTVPGAYLLRILAGPQACAFVRRSHRVQPTVRRRGWGRSTELPTCPRAKQYQRLYTGGLRGGSQDLVREDCLQNGARPHGGLDTLLVLLKLPHVT